MENKNIAMALTVSQDDCGWCWLTLRFKNTSHQLSKKQATGYLDIDSLLEGLEEIHEDIEDIIYSMEIIEFHVVLDSMKEKKLVWKKLIF